MADFVRIVLDVQIGAGVLKSLWPSARPEVADRLDEIKFQEKYFCDVINIQEKSYGKGYKNVALTFDHLIQHVQVLLLFLIQGDVLPHFARVTRSLDN